MLRLQEVLLWIKSVVEECGENITTVQLKDYVWKTLNSGKVVPGFVHGVFAKSLMMLFIIDHADALLYILGEASC
ncbi:hypothetical protein NC652_022747 [Populus alba x Populus x berolinensis]|nr:hypothetical protein NC652_022747 [Populus alba x Populus x berolinensis]